MALPLPDQSEPESGPDAEQFSELGFEPGFVLDSESDSELDFGPDFVPDSESDSEIGFTLEGFAGDWRVSLRFSCLAYRLKTLRRPRPVAEENQVDNSVK